MRWSEPFVDARITLAHFQKFYFEILMVHLELFAVLQGYLVSLRKLADVKIWGSD